MHGSFHPGMCMLPLNNGALGINTPSHLTVRRDHYNGKGRSRMM